MIKFKKNLVWYLLVILVSLPTYFFFISHPGYYYNMQDDMQVIRQLEMDKCVKDGQIPCRWSPDLGYQYGYPLFNFYPPFPSFVGQIFKTFGFSYMGSVKALAVTQYLLSSIFMFLLASSVFGNIGGFISTVFFMYAPYHALNIYVRGAYNEAWANVFFPLILYFSRNLIFKLKSKNIVGLAISFALLLLTHNPMVLIFTPVLALWVAFWHFQKHSFADFFVNLKKQITPFLSAMLLSFSLAAFFTLPLLFETKLVQLETMFTNYYSYLAHFVTLKQLFLSNFWGDGPSVWGDQDGMSFMVGYLHWIIPVLIFFYLVYSILKKKKINQLLLLSGFTTMVAFISVFMTHNKSTFIWQLFSPIQKIQFPWRFLNISTLLFSISIGAIPVMIKQIVPIVNVRKTLYIIITAFVVFLNLRFFYPITYGKVTDQQKFSGDSWMRLVTAGIYDYLPKTADRAAQKAATEYVDKVEPTTSLYTISGQKHGTDWLFFNLSLDNQAKVTISQLYFPNFKIFDYDKELSFTIEPEFGRMVIDLSPGQHQLFIKLFNTPIRTVSNIISLIAWLSVVIYLLLSTWKHWKSKN